MELFFKEIVSNKKEIDKVYWLQDYFYFGDKKRIATVTDVKFVGENKLVVAHRAAAKLYLIELYNDSIKIIDTLVLQNENEFLHPDSICIKNDIIYTTEYTKNCSVIQIQNDKLVLIRILEIDCRMFYHGCYSIDNLVYFGSVGCRDKNTPLTIYNTDTDQIKNVKINSNIRIKSVVIYNNYIILGTDTERTYKNSLRDTYLKFYKSDNDHNLEFINEIFLIETQVDGCAIFKNYFLFTIQSNIDNCGYIYVTKLIDNKLEYVRKIKCNDFPHGIDVCKNKLVYTSYTNESITIENLDKFIQSHDQFLE